MNRLEYDRQWRKNNRDKTRAAQKRYHAKHRERILRKRRAKYARNPKLNEAWRLANKEKIRANSKAWAERNRVTFLVGHARRRAVRKGLRFNIRAEDFALPTHCPVLGFRLSTKIRKGDLRSPSLDRIVPRKGYVRGNVAIISLRANLLKNNATPAELKALAKWTARVTA